MKNSNHVIGIMGISGAGKTALTKSLGLRLNTTTLFWDEYDIISQSPKDYVLWFDKGRDFSEWKYNDLAKTLHCLKSGKNIKCPVTGLDLRPSPYIIFDSPLGRNHLDTGQFIDNLILLDTPLYVALCRRLLRDFSKDSTIKGEEILEEVSFYLTQSRPLFLLNEVDRAKCDLIVNGILSVNEISDQIIKVLNLI